MYSLFLKKKDERPEITRVVKPLILYQYNFSGFVKGKGKIKSWPLWLALSLYRLTVLAHPAEMSELK
jgi:hypothetical protein